MQSMPFPHPVENAATGRDLVLLAMPTEEMGLGKTPGVDILADALREEIAALADVPVIEVARGGR
jgi:hypothetical protein